MEVCSSNMEYKTGQETFNSITRELSQLRKSKTKGFIYRVHEHLRNVNSKAYEPNILSIGPYHRDKASCKMMEEHKLRYLQFLVNRRKISLDTLVQTIGKSEQKARNCYAERFDDLSQDDFIKMLILDGCFIIELVRRSKDIRIQYPKDDPIFKTSWILCSLRRDLILFENQIPFFVLNELFEQIKEPNQLYTLIDLLLFFLHDLFPDKEYREPIDEKSRKERNITEDSVKHLLALIYKCWIPKSFDGAKEKNCLPCCVKHLLDLINGWWIPQSYDNLHDDNQMRIHSATVLKDANVKFKKKQSGDSLFEVDFKKGTILMPRLTIEDRTDCFFRNLIAYEQYFPYVECNYVADYVTFVDLLINSSKDVDELSQCGIIDNWLGDNEEVSKIFNKISDSVTLSGEHTYRKILIDINNHFKKPWNRWMAVLNRDYCSSPWRCISIFAALVLLALTIVQTVCSILQV